MIFYSATYNEGAPFMENEGDIRKTIHNASDLGTDGVLVLWGGEDIDPNLYKHPRHKNTGRHSRRDDWEWEMLLIFTLK